MDFFIHRFFMRIYKNADMVFVEDKTAKTSTRILSTNCHMLWVICVTNFFLFLGVKAPLWILQVIQWTNSFKTACLNIYGYICLCVTMHDYVWLYVTMYGYVWLYITKFDHLWICMTLYDHVWLCMAMDDYVRICMTIYDYEWLYIYM